MCRRLCLEHLESRQLLSAISFLQESADLYAVSRNASDLGQPIVPIYTNFNAPGDYRDPTVFAENVQLDGNDPHVDDVSGGTSSWCMTLNELGKTGWFQFNVGAAILRDIPEFGEASELRFLALGDVPGQELKIKVIGDLPGDASEMFWVRTLSTEWTDCAVTLPDGLRTSQIDAVQFVLGDGLNQGHGTVCLDEVRLNVDGYDPLRLAQSYRAGGWVEDNPAPPGDTVAYRDLEIYPKAAYLYDQALTIKALLAASRFQTAGDLADATIATGAGGGSYFNERAAGHVLKGDGTTVPPLSQKRTLGDNAWFGLALIDLYRALQDSDPARAIDYLNHARAISDWAESELKDSGLLGGYRGGYDEHGNAYEWRSVEQNLDTFQLNRLLAAELTALGAVDAATYADRARHAGDFVMYMFDDDEGKFWTGTGLGDAINTASVPLDTQLWSVLTLSNSTDYAAAIDWTEPLLWAETNLQTVDGAYAGFTFSSGSTPGIVWFEGTAHAALVYSWLGEEAKYAEQMEMLDNARDVHPYGDGSGLVAASRDGLADPAFKGMVFDSRLHLAATAWYFFAQWQINPFEPYVEVGTLWQNPVEPLDVNDDGFITPIDSLLIINYMNRNFGDPTPPADEPPPPYYDVNGDNYITPIDALQVINYLNRKEGEGEAAGGADTRESTGTSEISAHWLQFAPYDFTLLYPGRRTVRTMRA